MDNESCTESMEAKTLNTKGEKSKTLNTKPTLPPSLFPLTPSFPSSLSLRVAGGWRNLGGDHLLQGEPESEYEAEDSEGPGSVTHY
jgi:hypothetical protein